MRVVALVALLALLGAGPQPLFAGPRTATVTIKNDSLWPSAGKPIAVRIGGGAWRTVRPKSIGGPFTIAVGAKAKAIAIDVRSPTTARSFRRWAAVVPGARYKIVGNPCAHWGLEIDEARPTDDDTPVVADRVQIDTSAIPAARFPIVISTELGADEAPEPGDSTIVVDKPGLSAPLPLIVSAMCSRSGASIQIWSRSAPARPWFDETLIAHPGRLHTLRVTKTGAFTLELDGDR